MESLESFAGRRVGDFLLGPELGQGGMGTAHLAEQITLRREVVVKVIAASGRIEDHKVRFMREARLASRLDHPYAAHVYAFGAEPDGLLWIAMELVRGVPLDRMLAEQGPMPLARFVPLFDRLCEVVHSAHEQGIVHRDIKPANVMVVRRAGRLLPKLLDLGIARALDSVQPAAPLTARDHTMPLDALAIDADAAVDTSSPSVTLAGRVTGSPAYMAPEQWVDATRADARTDLYALGATAYELLTGKQLFTGRTVLEIARAHARGRIPPLGHGLPVALDQVMARALASNPAERYANVLELGTAIREAAHRAGAFTPGELDEVVRDAFVAASPQPIAEALRELARARAPDVAWAAVWQVVAVLVRVLAAVGIAARARTGDAAPTDEAARLIRILVERGLDLEEWVALIAALVAPFAAHAQAHPVPELVALCFDQTVRREPFEDLLALRRATSDSAIAAEDVQPALTELGKLLRTCTFLTDYGWVVMTATGGESWVGTRRDPRDRRDAPAGAAPGSVWLVDGDGTAVLELSPIIQIAPPAPGADDEAFLLDGPARRGARAIAWPREFERHDDALWQFVHDHAAPLGDRAAAAEQEDRAPYRGLATFGPGDAAMFFGREREVEAVVNRLRVHPLIAVVGPSGVGKSSFVHAGVVPALPDSWQALTVRPGASPLLALELKLLATGAPAVGLADRMLGDPGALREVIDATARQLGARLVLVIDQLEEMFTQCGDAAVRGAFASALANVAADADSPLRIVLTLRDDFLVRGAELPALGERLASGLELLTLPDADTLRRILVEPLARVGYTFETASLPDDMVAAVRDHPGALALLSFAAAKLWELRDRRFRHIPNKAFDAIGGVAGALARHAEDTLSALADDDRRLVRELFRHLVTSQGTRAVLLRGEALELLGKTAAAEHVIEALVERRLLVGSEGLDGGGERIEVIHEALLGAWPRLVTWQREDAAGAQLRDQLRTAARQWKERGSPKGLLWRGEALVEYRLWRSRQAGALTELERAFAAASEADEARTRRLRRTALAAAIAGLVIAILVLQHENGIAKHNAEVSRRTALALLAEQGRAALVSGKPQDAMVYLSAAYSGGADDPNLGFLLGATARALGGEIAVLRGHSAGIKGVAYTADGARAVTAGLDGTVRVWSARTGALERTIAASGTTVAGGVQLGPDDAVLTFGDGQPPTVWDLNTGARRFALAAAPGTIARYADDGGLIVSVGTGEVATWKSADGTRLATHAMTLSPRLLAIDKRFVAVATPTGLALLDTLDLDAVPVSFATARPVRTMDVGGNGARIVAVEEQSQQALVWDVAHPELAPHTLSGHAGDVLLARFSPDGSRIATTSLDHTAKVWDAATGRLEVSLDGHDGYVLPVVWSPDGETIATGSIDRTARLWDARTGAQRAVFYGHGDIVFRLAFDRSGQHLITGSPDATARIFDTHPPSSEVTLHHDGGPVSIEFSADSRRLLAVGHDQSAWVYDVATRSVVAAIDEYRVAANPSRLAALDDRRTGDLAAAGTMIVLPVGKDARVIRLDDRAHPVVLGPHAAAVTCARFGPGGEVVTGDADGWITIWNRAGQVARRIASHDGPIRDLVVDRTGRILIGTESAHGAARVYAADGTTPSSPLASVKGAILGVAFSDDGTLAATAADDTVARVFDLATGAERAASHSVSDLTAVQFSPDDRRIAVANLDGRATVYDPSDGRLLMHYGDGDSTGWATGIALSGDGRSLAIADDSGRIRIWNVTPETRSAAEVARDVKCHVPLVLVGSRLLARSIGDGDCK